MTVRIGLIITEGTGPLASASRLASLGAKRAFTKVGGRFDEHALVFTVRAESVLRATSTMARVIGAVQTARAAAGPDAAEAARSTTASTPAHVNGPALAHTEFEVLRQRIALLSSRVERLVSRNGG